MTSDQKAEIIFKEFFGGLDISLAKRAIRRSREFQRKLKATSLLQKQSRSQEAAFLRFQSDQVMKSAGEQMARGDLQHALVLR